MCDTRVQIIVLSLAYASLLTKANKSNSLIENLRRKLTQDNYDYAESTSPTTYTTPDHTNVIMNTDDVDNDDDHKDVSQVIKASDDSKMSYDEDVKYKEMMLKTKLREVANVTETRNINRVVQNKKPKYKILQVKPNRRSGARPQFIQEESEDAVAVINLGDGPFPEFRLPNARRQYMQRKDNVGVDELSPPALHEIGQDWHALEQ